MNGTEKSVETRRFVSDGMVGRRNRRESEGAENFSSILFVANFEAPQSPLLHAFILLMKRLISKIHPLVFFDVSIDGEARGRVVLEVRFASSFLSLMPAPLLTLGW